MAIQLNLLPAWLTIARTTSVGLIKVLKILRTASAFGVSSIPPTILVSKAQSKRSFCKEVLESKTLGSWAVNIVAMNMVIPN